MLVLQPAHIAGHHGVHLSSGGVPSVALVAPAPKDFRACPMEIGLIIAAIATVLIVVARDTVPDFWVDCDWKRDSRGAYGLSGAGRATSRASGSQSFGLWPGPVLACGLFHRPNLRSAGSTRTVMAAIANLCAAHCRRTLARPRRRRMALADHAAAPRARSRRSDPRIALVGSLVGHYPIHPELLTFALFEALFLCICAAYLFVSLVKDRIAARHQNVSLIDPLTGVSEPSSFS